MIGLERGDAPGESRGSGAILPAQPGLELVPFLAGTPLCGCLMLVGVPVLAAPVGIVPLVQTVASVIL
jgi:hypothetical protein